MAAVAFTKVATTQTSITYSWTGDAAGTLANTTLITDCEAGPLKSALQLQVGETDSNAKAEAAVLSGASYTGATGATKRSYVRSSLIWSTGATALPLLTAVDSGAGNAADIVITVAAAGTGYLRIEFPQVPYPIAT